MVAEEKAVTPRQNRTPSQVAIAGTAWQGFLAGLGVAVKWIDSTQELAELAKELADLARSGEPVALDFETTGDFVAGGIRPRLVQLFAGGDDVAVADLDVTGFAPIACLAGVGCVAYAAGFEARVFMGQGLDPKLNDAALAAGLRLDRDAFQRDLATTWRRIKGKPTPTSKKAMQRSDFSGELTAEQIAYAGSDAIMAFEVWEACRAEARSRPYAVARDAIPAVASMEMAGLGYDHAAHVAIVGEWNRVAKNEARRFHEMTGLWPNEQKTFRERLQSSVDPDLLESWPRADKGGLSLSAKALEHKPQAKLPEVAQYLRAKALGTLITTFGPRMAARVSPLTRRLHFGFTLCGARTGRMTSSPNGQNLPAGPYRRIFRAPPGRRVVSLDYSAIELRAAALLAGEKSLLDVFKHPPRLPNGERNPEGDPHEALSATLQLDPVRNAGLRLAKALNFRLLYGTGVEGFAENANISIEEAQELVARWRRVRPSLVQWQSGTKAAGKRQRYATTPLGRRVNCYDVDPVTKSLRFKPNRALNVPIQGGCAEALMVALPLAYDGLRGSGLSAALIAAVHDEIVFECAEADVEPATAIVRQAMMTGLEKVFGARPRFQDIALYAVGAPKVGQTWDGDAFDLASLSEKETMVLLKGLADVDEGEENDEEEHESNDDPEPADPEDDRDELVKHIRETTLKLLRQVDPRRLRLAFRQAGVELLHRADAAKLADLARRLSEPLPTDETPEHCRLGPSSAARWLNCPGSVIAIEEAPSYSSVHAHEGHKAHMALEWCLRLDVVPSQIVDPGNWPDVARSVEVALEYIRRQVGELHVEVRFMIDDEVGLGGTADTVAVNDQEIVVVDFKHGKTAIVVRDNAQLQTYAIGARQRFGERKRYRLVIIQPRAGRPTDVTEWTVTDADLRHFERQLLTAAKATMQVDVVRRAGAWCQWCPARATCDEYRARQGAEGDVAAGRVRFQSHGSDAVWNVGASTAGELAHADMGPKIGEGALPGLSTLPNAGSYGVIVADPPWRFDVRNRDTGLRRSPDQHYSTMTLADIKALPVGQIAGPDCWLLLWTTGPHLPQAFEVMEAWGFRYSSLGFMWVKLRRGYRQDRLGILPSDIAMGLGYTTRKASEPCLLGRRGNPRRLRNDVRDVIIAPVREHSRKPDEFYERVEQFAAGPRLELFAREHRQGWDGWGNELDKFQGAVRHTLPSAVAPGGVDPALR